jgi:maltooligosyltrehalose trehalohydrolase
MTSPIVDVVAPNPVVAASQATSTYRVWAPRANRVWLYVASENIPMLREDTGWWSSHRPVTAGEDYGFRIDNDGPFPDPRSAFQPAGVHGLSRAVDHSAYVWNDAQWQPPPFSSAVVYELHVGTFTETGTFGAAIDRLQHLVDLGVTHVELMPVCEFPGEHGWGYDGVHLFAVHHAYGGPDGLKQFVDACHAHGLAVILDVVYNHLGPDGNYLAKFGPYFTERYKTPWGDAVNLDDTGADAVRQFFCDNAVMWLRDYHIDGLRLDAVHALVDMSAIHLLEQLSTTVDELEASLGRHLTLIAESDLNDPRIVWRREAHGYGIDAQWSDDFHHALHSVLTGERSGYYADFGSLSSLASAIRQVFVYDGQYSAYRGRRHGRPADGCHGSQFVVSAQNHDQIGNRANGDRLSHLVTPARLEIAAALLLTSPYIPMLFQGEEWGATSRFLYFTAHENETLAACVREGRRQEFAAFGWDPSDVPDPQARDTFTRSKLVWDQAARPRHHRLLDWHRALIALRRATPALTDGHYQQARCEWDDHAGWLAIHRGPITIACNLGNRPQTISLGRRMCTRLASSNAGELPRDVMGQLLLPPDSVAILEATSAENDERRQP